MQNLKKLFLLKELIPKSAAKVVTWTELVWAALEHLGITKAILPSSYVHTGIAPATCVVVI